MASLSPAPASTRHISFPSLAAYSPHHFLSLQPWTPRVQAIRQYAARASTLITHKHMQQIPTARFDSVRFGSVPCWTFRVRTNRLGFDQYPCQCRWFVPNWVKGHPPGIILIYEVPVFYLLFSYTRGESHRFQHDENNPGHVPYATTCVKNLGVKSFQVEFCLTFQNLQLP